jgi:hypothetical protein
VTLSNDIHGAEPVLKEVAGTRATRLAIAPTGKTAVELAHSGGQAGIGETNQEMEVIRKQAPIEYSPVAADAYAS